MADILRITMGKRSRVEIDGKDETFYIETEASYQPGELPIDDAPVALRELASKVDSGLDVWTGHANTTTTTVEHKAPSPASDKQKAFIETLMLKAGAGEQEVKAALDGLANSQQASDLIKKLQGKTK
jgi:hypothetical protein